MTTISRFPGGVLADVGHERRPARSEPSERLLFSATSGSASVAPTTGSARRSAATPSPGRPRCVNRPGRSSRTSMIVTADEALRNEPRRTAERGGGVVR